MGMSRSLDKGLVVGPDLPESLHPLGGEAGTEDGEGLQVLPVLLVEGQSGHQIHEGTYSVQVLDFLWQFLRLAGEEFLETVDGAAASLV